MLKERKDNNIKKAIAAALKEVKTKTKPKVIKPIKRPKNMNKGGMANDMRKSGLFK